MIEIRHVRIEDAEVIAAILNAIIAARIYTALDTPVTVEEERRFISNYPARGIFHVACDGAFNRVVGFQDVEPFATFTHAFDHVGVIGTYVDPVHHRKGIAMALFAATFEAACRKGYEKLFSYVRADNEPGLKTYLRQGFRVVGTAERHARIDGRDIDEILIERFIL